MLFRFENSTVSYSYMNIIQRHRRQRPRKLFSLKTHFGTFRANFRSFKCEKVERKLSEKKILLLSMNEKTPFSNKVREKFWSITKRKNLGYPYRNIIFDSIFRKIVLV